MEGADCAVMCTARNQYMTGAQVLDILGDDPHPVSIISLRRAGATRVFGLSIFFVKFASKEEQEEVLRRDFSETGITVSEIDSLSFTADVAVIWGFPKCQLSSYFANLIKSLGPAHIQVLEKTNGTKDIAILASFQDRQTCDDFLRTLDGATIWGQTLTASRLIYEDAIRYQATYPRITDVLSDDFDFSLIYYGRSYQCWSGAAIALSGKIYEKCLEDHDISEFHCPAIPGPFALLCDYFRGGEVQINEKNCGFFIAIAKAMEIPELYEKAHAFAYQCGDINSMLTILEQLFIYDLPFDDQLDFVASKLDPELLNTFEVRKYPIELLEMLFASPYFSIEVEDSFLEFVLSLRHLMPEKFKKLLPHVRIQKLTNTALAKLIGDWEVDLNCLRIGLLQRGNSITFSQPQNRNDVPRNLRSLLGLTVSVGDLIRTRTFRMQDGQLFHGILHHLCTMCGDNAARAGLVEISASSRAHGEPSMLIDENNMDYFGTIDRAGSWIMVDFQNARISLTGYSLRTHRHEGNGHITGWTIECKNDGDWVLVDQRENVTELSRLGNAEFFSVPNPSPRVRFVKLTQTLRNTMGYNNLRLSAIEFFGSWQVCC